MGDGQTDPATDPGIATRDRYGAVLERAAFIVGSIGLLAAMSTDALAVLGRHVGLPVLGSIEVVQASVVLLASAAMVGATLRSAHARAHLVVDRLGPVGKRRILRCADMLSAGVFAVFAIGSTWIAGEMWGSHEHSELLHIPWRWLRVIWIVSALIICGVFLRRAFGRVQSES